MRTCILPTVGYLKWVRLLAVVAFMGAASGQRTEAAALPSTYERWAYIDEIQVIADDENGNEYSYAKILFTSVNQGSSQEHWVVPLQRNGIDYSGAKYIESVLQQAVATGSKVYLGAVDTWGLGAHSYFSLFEDPRIRRAILYK
jgi:hypothetical protein